MSVLCSSPNRSCSDTTCIARCVTQVHVELNKPQDNDTADQVLASTDVLLLLLMGAADATARVAHSTLGLTMNPHDSGWQRERWMKAVSEEAPEPRKALRAGDRPVARPHDPASLTKRDPWGGAPASRCRCAAAPRTHARGAAGPRRSREVTQAIEALGGTEEWGVESVIPGRLHFDPGVFVEELLPARSRDAQQRHGQHASRAPEQRLARAQ